MMTVFAHLRLGECEILMSISWPLREKLRAAKLPALSMVLMRLARGRLSLMFCVYTWKQFSSALGSKT